MTRMKALERVTWQDVQLLLPLKAWVGYTFNFPTQRRDVKKWSPTARDTKQKRHAKAARDESDDHASCIDLRL
jgi:hypothetical protein